MSSGSYSNEDTIEAQPKQSKFAHYKFDRGHSFWSNRFTSVRRKIALHYFLNYLIMGIGVLGIFSISWGSFYGNEGRLKNLNMLVVIEDDTTIDGIPPVFGDTLKQILDTPEARARGNWQLANVTDFRIKAASNNRSVEDEILHEIHRQYYWSSFYVPTNASVNYFRALVNEDINYAVSENTIKAIYETGRDYFGMNQFITPSIGAIETIWFENQPNMTYAIAGNLTINSGPAFQILATPIPFKVVDPLPFNAAILVGPFHDGLVYTNLLSLMQFAFFSPIHKMVATLGLKRSHYITYRFLSSLFAFFILSLFVCLVTLAFQVDMTTSYGRAGFVVYWMITFLTMWALGAVNEIFAMLLTLVYPPIVQFWILFWIIINISPTFTPIALTPKFYRYGYAMPVHNCYEAIKTVFFKVYRAQLGRNIGILVAWFTVAGLVLPFVIFYYTHVMFKKDEENACKEISEIKED